MAWFQKLFGTKQEPQLPESLARRPVRYWATQPKMAIVVLKSTIPNWDDFCNTKYDFFITSSGKLFVVRFHGLARKDDNFAFQLDLSNADIRGWIKHLCNRGKLLIVNGNVDVSALQSGTISRNAETVMLSLGKSNVVISRLRKLIGE